VKEDGERVSWTFSSRVRWSGDVIQDEGLRGLVVR